MIHEDLPLFSIVIHLMLPVYGEILMQQEFQQLNVLIAWMVDNLGKMWDAFLQKD